MKYTIDWKEYAGIAREAVAEGCVLLKNDSALPIKKDSKISIFGRIQFHYYKSGTGSGGMVNVPYVVSILDIEEMSKYLKEYKGRSSTSCPGVADWLESFGDADEVFGVCLTSKISGGYNAAMTAAAQYMEEHPGRKVHMVDTHTTGPELEVLVEKLQELCATDKAFEEIVEEITEYNKHTNLMFALASVDNFAKNGRVNPLVAKAASVLGIRIVGRASEEGELEPISKIRGEKAAIAKLADYIVEEGFNGGRIIIRHSFNENAAKALADKILSKFPDCNLSIDINFGLCVYYAEPGSILVGFEN